MDQVLAGLLIQAANSPYYSPYRPIADISHAIACIGLETARKVLLAAALRTTFDAAPLSALEPLGGCGASGRTLARCSKLRPDPTEAS
jgi:HD-like signal output (HDOD) protein